MISLHAEGIQEQLAQSLFDHIPVGVGSKGVIPTSNKDLIEALVCIASCLVVIFSHTNTSP
jgi:hypothetical protein